MTALRRLSTLFCWLLLASAFAARAAVPAGWMPVSTTQGIAVILCGGQGPVTLELAGDGTLHPRQQDNGPRDPCPFGLAGAQPLDLARLPDLPLPPAALAVQHRPGLLAARLIAWRAMRPPARGPPVLA
jgi:hypothetical protein